MDPKYSTCRKGCSTCFHCKLLPKNNYEPVLCQCDIAERYEHKPFRLQIINLVSARNIFCPYFNGDDEKFTIKNSKQLRESIYAAEKHDAAAKKRLEEFLDRIEKEIEEDDKRDLQERKQTDVDLVCRGMDYYNRSNFRIPRNIKRKSCG